MRLASGLLASALSLSLGLLACSRFTAADDSGSEPFAEAGTESGMDGAFDAGGFVVVDNQAMATELVADDKLVVWSFAGGISAADPTMEHAAPTPVSTRAGVSLQLLGDRVFFADTGTVYYAQTDGGQLDSGSRSITPQGTNLQIRAQYTFANAVTFASGNQLEWCAGSACGAANPNTITLDAGVGAMRSDPAGDILYLSAGSELRSFDSTKLAAIASIEVMGGVGAFVIDELKAFYSPSAGGVIYAKDLTSDAPAVVLTTVTGHPYALALDSASLYVALFDSGTVLKVNKATGATTTIAADLVEPRSLALSSGRVLVLTDGKILSYPKGD